MFEKIITMWFFVIFILLIPLNYRALMAMKFSNLFNRGSTWQIRYIMLIVSIILAFLISFAFVFIVERMAGSIN